MRDDEPLLMQEVYSIRARRHPNIVEFYASFIAGRECPLQSNEQVDCLHLLFEHADGGNMKSWLTQSTTPCNLKTDFDRGEEILRCVQDLVDAVTFIHSNIEGYTSFHHDIKPSNIVLVTGPPATWKLCDFGMANLKHHQDDSGTRPERYDGIGTYDYRPPEYESERFHGRSFDVYSLGCVFLELATIWAYGWDDKKLEEFYYLRGDNEKKAYSELRTPDHSYHNNPDVVASWFQQLRQKKVDHKCFRQFLDLTADMMESRPRRVFIWEANMELFEMVEVRSEKQLKDHFRKIVQPPKTPVNGLDNLHNPLRMASKKGKLWQLKILRDNAWSDEKPQTGLLPTLSSEQGEHFSTLDTCPENNEYESNGLFGRHGIDKEISKILDQRDCVGLYGTSGVG
jgi:serine/threonine protein kinase